MTVIHMTVIYLFCPGSDNLYQMASQLERVTWNPISSLTPSIKRYRLCHINTCALILTPNYFLSVQSSPVLYKTFLFLRRTERQPILFLHPLTSLLVISAVICPILISVCFEGRPDCPLM